MSLIEARYHKCRLCSKDILCDKLIIGKHCYSTHQISLAQYMSGENGKHKMPLSDSVAVKFQKGDRYKRLFVKNTIPHNFISEKVANVCTFTCPHCGKKSVCLSSFSNHLSRCCGRMTFVPQNVTEARYYECRLCAKLMLCDHHFVKSHIWSHRSVTTFEAYLEKEGKASAEETQEIRQRVQADDSYWKRAERIVRAGDRSKETQEN